MPPAGCRVTLIPAGPAGDQSPHKPARLPSRRLANTGVRTGIRVIIIAAAIIAVLVLAPSRFTDNGIAFLAALGAAATVVVASALTATLGCVPGQSEGSRGPGG